METLAHDVAASLAGSADATREYQAQASAEERPGLEPIFTRVTDPEEGQFEIETEDGSIFLVKVERIV